MHLNVKQELEEIHRSLSRLQRAVFILGAAGIVQSAVVAIFVLVTM